MTYRFMMIIMTMVMAGAIALAGAGPARAESYSALALGKLDMLRDKHFAFGSGMNEPTLEEARAQALRDCSTKRVEDCTVVVEFTSGCFYTTTGAKPLKVPRGQDPEMYLAQNAEPTYGFGLSPAQALRMCKRQGGGCGMPEAHCSGTP